MRLTQPCVTCWTTFNAWQKLGDVAACRSASVSLVHVSLLGPGRSVNRARSSPPVLPECLGQATTGLQTPHVHCRPCGRWLPLAPEGGRLPRCYASSSGDRSCCTASGTEQCGGCCGCHPRARGVYLILSAALAEARQAVMAVAWARLPCRKGALDQHCQITNALPCVHCAGLPLDQCRNGLESQPAGPCGVRCKRDGRRWHLWSHCSCARQVAAGHTHNVRCP